MLMITLTVSASSRSNSERVALGISAYDFNDAKQILGKNSKEISKILGFEGRDEVVHKDNLVKLSI